MMQQYVHDAKLCVSCGICAAVCPQKCIQMTWEKGQMLPVIDAVQCIHCGKCERVCSQSLENTCQTGPVTVCYSAWEKDPEKLKKSVSGGVITAMVDTLLADGSYDLAWLVAGVTVNGELAAAEYHAGDDLDQTRKSKYVPVNFQAAATAMIDRPEAKMIFVATPCVVKSLLNLIKMHRLNRSNYLLIGLFCDRTLNYNVLSYFERFSGKELQSINFRDKGKNGWPGEVKIYCSDGTEQYLSRLVRSFSKEYFQMECCLYCSDKLNDMADISIGDDYTYRKDKLGKNSVIVRTELGAEAFEKVLAEKEPCFLEEIQRSQAVVRKDKNKEFRKSLCDQNFSDKVVLSELAEKKAKIEQGREYPQNKQARRAIHRTVDKKLAFEKMRAMKRWVMQAGKKE